MPGVFTHMMASIFQTFECYSVPVNPDLHALAAADKVIWIHPPRNI